MDSKTIETRRFFANIVKRPGPLSTDCWIWTKSLTCGYGQMTVGNRSSRAHRWAYENLIGPIPDGLDILHQCDVRSCVNPAHLRAGSHAENMIEAWDRGLMKKSFGERNGRHTKPESTCWGAKSYFAKLDDERVRAIYADPRRYKYIAAFYGITTRTVSSIKTGETWRHLRLTA